MINLDYFTRKKDENSLPNKEDFEELIEVFSKYEDSWHLDKKVPIVFICALLFQTGSFIWWASSMNTRVENSVSKSWAIRLETEVKEIRKDLDNEVGTSATKRDVDHLGELMTKSLSHSQEQMKHLTDKLGSLDSNFKNYIFTRQPPLK